MIEINLLPEDLRKREATPLPRRLAIYVGAGLLTGLGFLNAFQWLRTVPAHSGEVDDTAERLKAILEVVERDVAPLERATKTLDLRRSILGQIEPGVFRWAPRLDALQQVLAAELPGVWIKSLSYEERPPKSKTGANAGVLLERRLLVDFLASDFSESPDLFTMMNEERISDVARRLSRNPVFNRDLVSVEALSWTHVDDYRKAPWNVRAIKFPISFLLTPVRAPEKPKPPPPPKKES